MALAGCKRRGPDFQSQPTMGFYSAIVRPLAFHLEAERAHDTALRLGGALAWAAPALRPLLSVNDPRLATEVAGLKFPHPIGLAAGFDKSAQAIELLASLGFGSLEIGSVSIDPSDGNPKPRLWRLPQDHALLVHYGLPNHGARAVAARIAGEKLPVPLGVNIAVTNRGPGAPPLSAERIIAEYAGAARLLAPHADYLMLNLSCPNTEDGRDFFLDGRNIDACLAALGKLGLQLPVFVKVSSLGGVEAVERVLAAADRHAFVKGFMFNQPPGKPERMRTPEALWRHLPGTVAGLPSLYRPPELCTAECFRRMDRSRHVLLAAGGVDSAESAYAKIRGGASLVQIFTAMVYEGPLLARRIARGLSRLLERDGFKSVADAVGADVR
ncbi:MAG: quinone-dependent dihydroorotate dehydrogenase [Alphaproteobacteria bacterium]|nr:quinone-dependent dihydroorotate dehydrogenase [Alphaproteobacteria bacterium]